MKKIALLLIILITSVSFVGYQEQHTAIAQEATQEVTQNTTQAATEYSIDQFLNTISYAGGTFNHDETKILFSTDESGVFNIYSYQISDGKLTQLTHSTTHSNFVISTFPDDDRLLFTSDASGDELNHIYLLNTDLSIKDLTPYPHSRSEFAGWSDHKNSFYFKSNHRDARYMDLYERDLNTNTTNMVYKNDLGFEINAISPNRHYVSLEKIVSRNGSEIYLYDFETHSHRLISPQQHDVKYDAAGFSPNSQFLYYLTDENSEFVYLKEMQIETKMSETLAKYDWDISAFGESRTGRYQMTAVNEDAKRTLHVYDNLNHGYLQFPETVDGAVNNVVVSRSEHLMLLSVSGCRSPRNLYLYHPDTGVAQKITHALSHEVDPNHLVAGEVIRFPSYDQMAIPGIYYKPQHVKDGDKIPALIWVHGGPGGQSSIEYNYLIQYLVNHGYAVLAINNRGSSGYGKSFFKAADLKHGDADLDDCIEAKKFLKATGYIDENKIGIIGGSYGGYMTLAALAFRPNEMAVGVDIFGVSNWVRTLKSIPAWWEVEKDGLYKKIGNPETDEEYLKSISPVFHGKNIVKPLLVLQGANDPRVLKVESDQIIDAVKDNGVPYEYVVFDDEGHGFLKKKNMKHAAESILRFLDTHLKSK